MLHCFVFSLVLVFSYCAIFFSSFAIYIYHIMLFFFSTLYCLTLRYRFSHCLLSVFFLSPTLRILLIMIVLCLFSSWATSFLILHYTFSLYCTMGFFSPCAVAFFEVSSPQPDAFLAGEDSQGVGIHSACTLIGSMRRTLQHT